MAYNNPDTFHCELKIVKKRAPKSDESGSSADAAAEPTEMKCQCENDYNCQCDPNYTHKLVKEIDR